MKQGIGNSEQPSTSVIPIDSFRGGVVMSQSLPRTVEPANIHINVGTSVDMDPDPVSLKNANNGLVDFKPVTLASHVLESNRKRKRQPVFSSESSSTEYTTSSCRSQVSITSPHFEDYSDCASSVAVTRQEVVFIHLSSDSDCDVEVD